MYPIYCQVSSFIWIDPKRICFPICVRTNISFFRKCLKILIFGDKCRSVDDVCAHKHPIRTYIYLPTSIHYVRIQWIISTNHLHSAPDRFSFENAVIGRSAAMHCAQTMFWKWTLFSTFENLNFWNVLCAYTAANNKWYDAYHNGKIQIALKSFKSLCMVDILDKQRRISSEIPDWTGIENIQSLGYAFILPNAKWSVACDANIKQNAAKLCVWFRGTTYRPTKFPHNLQVMYDPSLLLRTEYVLLCVCVCVSMLTNRISTDLLLAMKNGKLPIF